MLGVADIVGVIDGIAVTLGVIEVVGVIDIVGVEVIVGVIVGVIDIVGVGVGDGEGAMYVAESPDTTQSLISTVIG